MRLRDAGDYLRRRDEERLVRRQAMSIGERLPMLVVEVHLKQVRRIRDEVRRRHPTSPYADWNEGGCLAEYAFAAYLRSLKVRFEWSEFGGHLRHDFTLASGVTVGVRSMSHRRLMRLPAASVSPLRMAYPVRRLSDAEAISDYVLACSVFLMRSGVAWIAFWSLMSRERLVSGMRQVWRGKDIPSDNSCVFVCLDEDADVRLSSILQA